MSVADVDRDLRLHERLEALMFQWGIDNGDSSFEIHYDGCSDRAFTIVHITGEESEEDDETLTSSYTVRYDKWNGATLAEAVEFAWTTAGRMLVCTKCEGIGSLTRWAQAGEGFTLEEGERADRHHDNSVSLVKSCVACGGEGMIRHD